MNSFKKIQLRIIAINISLLLTKLKIVGESRTTALQTEKFATNPEREIAIVTHTILKEYLIFFSSLVVELNI